MPNPLMVEWVPLSAVRPDPNNPRAISRTARKRLASSMQRFGWAMPLLALRDTGMLVAGHQRYEIAKELRHATVPVVFLDGYTSQRAAVLNVALNNVDRLGAQFDSTKLLAIAEYVRDADATLLDDAGFDLKVIAEYVGGVMEQDEFSSEDEARAPADVVLAVGPYRFRVKRESYLDWEIDLKLRAHERELPAVDVFKQALGFA